MRTAAVSQLAPAQPEPHPCTLLELVRVLTEITDDDREVVGTVLHMLCSGSVRLVGNFRGSSWKDLA
jgi:hypothetical protein